MKSTLTQGMDNFKIQIKIQYLTGSPHSMGARWNVNFNDKKKTLWSRIKKIRLLEKISHKNYSSFVFAV